MVTFAVRVSRKRDAKPYMLRTFSGSNRKKKKKEKKEKNIQPQPENYVNFLIKKGDMFAKTLCTVGEL